MKHKEFTTRTELKSLTRSIKCAETECGRLRMLSECLGPSSMRLGVPFIAPRQLGVVGGQQGRLSLPSVGWRTGQPGAPPDSHCSCPVRDLLPILAQTTVAESWRLAHQTLSGAHRTVRCPLPTVGVGHASPADCAADRCAGGRWLTGQSGAPPDSLVNYSHTLQNFPESNVFTGVQPGAPDTVRCTTGHCPVHHRTVRCARPSCYLAIPSQVFCISFLFFFSLFLALRLYMLVHKNQYTKSRSIPSLCFALLSPFGTKELN
jgi:hypothetical protein